MAFTSRTFSLFILIFAALVCLTMASPTIAKSKSKKPCTFTFNDNYNTSGLPRNIFPNLSKLKGKCTDNLHDGIRYLREQGSGKKMPN
ncbi:uncharacterized protein BX663DRAFT_520983 [Cokeromyces recurvatus]|uniref:uncharacterized protein n=1 Tax=Cokeromyces recurvatus TaxID=90255 RepID=UPI002220D5EA|nr:uncharacterized protein BX663DRAFT_520983 [Cokeromyces recurvatus]KAI7899460.1 hypothetical protein BX663DRAFT_520983 [Cokeromyces recurvatus]